MTVIQSIEKLRAAQKALRQYGGACKAAFPVGTEVAYRHVDSVRHGRVEDVGDGYRLKIRGADGTGYWVDTHRLLTYSETSAE